MFNKRLMIVAAITLTAVAQSPVPLEIIRPTARVFYYGDTITIEYTGYTLLNQDVGKIFTMSFDSGKTFDYALFSTRDSWYDTAEQKVVLSASTFAFAGIDTTIPKYCLIRGQCYKTPGQYYSPDTSSGFILQSRHPATRTISPVLTYPRAVLPRTSNAFSLSGRLIPSSRSVSVTLSRDRGFIRLH